MTPRKAIVDELQSKLPKGFAKTVRDRYNLDFSTQYIYAVARGEYENEVVLERLIQYAGVYQRALKRKLERLQTI